MDKVLHVLPMNKMSGAERMALLICKNMKQYEPIVVCGGEKLKDIFENSGIKSYAISFSNKKMFTTLMGIKKIIRENDIKIIHAHDNNASLNAYLTKVIFRLDIKVISHIHSCYPFLNGMGINKKIDSIFRKKYDHNIVCGKLVYDFYNENAYYFPKEKTTVLSNAIDIEEILNRKSCEYKEVISEFNIPMDKKILGFVGRICDIKGIVPFIYELSKWRDQFKDCKILLVGNGNQEDQVKDLIRSLKLEDIFILTGFQENVYKFYPVIDLFFLPSRYEGLPMVILEAMAFKKPVISMDVGSINELIYDGKTGYLIESGNYNEFVRKLIEVKGQDNLIEKLGRNAFDYINRNYNIKIYVKNIENLYDKQMS